MEQHWLHLRRACFDLLRGARVRSPASQLGGFDVRLQRDDVGTEFSEIRIPDTPPHTIPARSGVHAIIRAGVRVHTLSAAARSDERRAADRVSTRWPGAVQVSRAHV